MGETETTKLSNEAIRQVAQSNPIPSLAARWGDTVADARKKVAALDDSLRELDHLTSLLAGYELVVATDLGPVGNAARSARTAALADAVKPGYVAPVHRIA